MPHTVATVLVVGLALVANRASADEASAPARVRSENPTIARLIAQAIKQSATFRRQIEAINGTDGLVYVHAAPCRHGVRACLVHTVTLAGPYRLLNVKLSMGRPALETIASLGHELQHAIEVLNDPLVRNDSSISAFFRRLAPTDSHEFETPAALQAGSDVYDELIAAAKQQRAVKADKNAR